MTKSPDTRLRVIFAGTPDFAAAALASILASKHELVAVYTQPDRRAGRGRKINASPVKQLALEHSIPVYQPSSLKHEDAQAQLQALNADVMVVAAYGLILPAEVLGIPRLGCVNIHASLLPRWRGAAPIQHAILAGDRETGITIMQMDEGLDTGAMLLTRRCPIAPEDTGSRLHDRLAALGADAVVTALGQLHDLQQRATPQDSSQSTYASKLSKQDARIDWSLSAEQLARQVRAFNAWPVAFSQLNDITVRIWQATTIHADGGNTSAGALVEASTAGIDVACGEGLLRLQVLQLPGAKALPVADLLNAKQELFTPGSQWH